MLDDVFSTQTIADQLKPLIRSVKSRSDDRRAAMELLQAFERCSWHVPAFEDAMQQVSTGNFVADDTRRLSYDGDDALTAVTELLSVYLHSVCAEELPSERDKQRFSTAEAARYLGITNAAVRHHIYVTGELIGQKIGHSLVFSKSELDALKASKRPVGRPPTRTTQA